mgnify:CR=1 FL=1
MGGACGAAAQREGCGGRPEGAVSPRAARRDGAPRTPEQPDPERSEGARQKTNLESHAGIGQNFRLLPPKLANLNTSSSGWWSGLKTRLSLSPFCGHVGAMAFSAYE